VINADRLVETFCALVAIDSPSGEEHEVMAYLTETVEGIGFEVKEDSHGNLIASKGIHETTAAEEILILSAHMDTVEPGRGIVPVVNGEEIVSQGDTVLGGDCKAGVAAILEGVRSAVGSGRAHKPVQLVFTREEEVGLVGAKNLNYGMILGKRAVVFDGEGAPNVLTDASPTYLRFDIRVVGRGAHAGVEPEKGLSAATIAADLVLGLPLGRIDDETTMNIGIIQGGSARNAVPEIVHLEGEIRSHNREKLTKYQDILKQQIQRVTESYPGAKIEMNDFIEFEGYQISPSEPVAVDVIAALSRMGLDYDFVSSGGGTDGNIFALNGIRAVVVGMATNGAHTVREFVRIPELIQAALLCEELVGDPAGN
jgi:tripeptide aminopeptidase